MGLFKKLRCNWLGFLSFLFISSSVLLAIFAYLIIPDKSENANQMHLSIHSKPIGFSTDMLVLTPYNSKKELLIKTWFFGSKSISEEIPIKDYFVRRDSLFYKETNSELVKVISLNANSQRLPKVKKTTFLLGTDKYGRDVFSRLILGLRVSLSIGLVSVLISLLTGVLVGAISGYYGGITDTIALWFINVSWSIPTLLFVIAISLALGKGYWQVFIAVGLTMWVEVARVVRGQILSIKKRQFITAAKALGYSNFRIIKRHILPHTVGSLVVVSSANFATAILLESGLSFLGVGLQPPTPGWGTMLKDHYNNIVLGNTHLAIIPGMAIVIMVMAFMLLGNSIQEINRIRT